LTKKEGYKESVTTSLIYNVNEHISEAWKKRAKLRMM